MQQNYNEEYYLKYGDPRTVDWPLMDNVSTVILFGIGYLLMVKVIGPLWMNNRKPYELRKVMFIYNSGMVFLNLWLFQQLFKYVWLKKDFSMRCQPIDFSFNEDAVHVAKIGWISLISKFVQFADTMFLVLRKKDISFYVYQVPHHFITPIYVWYLVKYSPGGYNIFILMTNLIMLCLMYFYAAALSLGPSVRKYLWWKKYISPLQLILYSAAILYALQIYLLPPTSCKVSFFVLRINVAFMVIFLSLSLHVYIKFSQKKKLGKEETDPGSICLPQDDNSDIHKT